MAKRQHSAASANCCLVGCLPLLLIGGGACGVHCRLGGGANAGGGWKAGGDGAYPFAHACANSLDMPSYSSPAVLRERLEAAVDAAHDKFTDL